MLKLNKRKIFIRSIWITLIFTILSASVLYFLYEKEVTTNIEFLQQSSLQNIGTYVDLINKDIQQINADLLILSDIADYKKVLTEPKYKEEAAYHFLNYSSAKKIFDQIRFLNIKGDEIIRVNYNNGKPAIVDSHLLQNKSERYYYKELLKTKKGEFYVSPLDLNIEHGEIEKPLKPMIRLGLKVFNQKNNKLIGLIIVNYLAEDLLNKLHSRDKTNIGEFYLLNKDSFYLHNHNKKKEWGFMFGTNFNFKNDHKNAYKKIYSTYSGQFLNESGSYSFSTVFPLNNSQTSSLGTIEVSKKNSKVIKNKNYFWKVVVFIPQNLISQKTFKNLSKMTFFIVFVFIVFAIISILLSYAWERRLLVEKKLIFNLNELKENIEKVKKLEGILPLCSYCKKVRDDEGYWNQVDSYIHEHSEAQISHSICPDCLEEHFPKVAEKIKNKKENNS